MRTFRTRQRHLGGPSRDMALYGQAPNARTYQAAMYEARMFAAAIRDNNSLDVGSSSNTTNAAAPWASSTSDNNIDVDGSEGDPVLAGLGDLDYLPIEVVMIVLEHCTLRALLRLQRVNRTACTMVRCLRDFESVADTIKGNKARARGPYPKIWATLMRINTFQGLRQLMLCKVCDKCGDKGAKLRVAKVKILCEKCDNPTKFRLAF
ncbi:hypothetical protein PG987_001741 [Apiospora arundinis]